MPTKDQAHRIWERMKLMRQAHYRLWKHALAFPAGSKERRLWNALAVAAMGVEKDLERVIDPEYA